MSTSRVLLVNRGTSKTVIVVAYEIDNAKLDKSSENKSSIDPRKSTENKPLEWLTECVTRATMISMLGNTDFKCPDEESKFTTESMYEKFMLWMQSKWPDETYSRKTFDNDLSKVLKTKSTQIKRKGIKRNGYRLSLNSIKELVGAASST